MNKKKLFIFCHKRVKMLHSGENEEVTQLDIVI